MYVIFCFFLLIQKNYFIIPPMTAQVLSIIVMLITLLRLILGGLIIKEGVNNKGKREKVMRYLIGVKKLSDTPLNKGVVKGGSKAKSIF